MHKTVNSLLYWTGASLWIPCIALFPITPTFGWQALISLASCMIFLLVCEITRIAFVFAVPKAMLLFYSTSVLEGAVCTLASQDIARSVDTFIIEIVRLAHSATIWHWNCKERQYLGLRVSWRVA